MLPEDALLLILLFFLVFSTIAAPGDPSAASAVKRLTDMGTRQRPSEKKTVLPTGSAVQSREGAHISLALFFFLNPDATWLQIQT